jgi:adenine-specific DNA methylase
LFRFQSAKAEQIKKLKKKGSTVIITDSPYKNDLETAKESDKSLAGLKQLFGGKNPKKTKKTQAPKRMKTAAKEDKSSSDDDDQEHAECLYCNSLFSQSKKGEGWVSCSLCKRWAHEECAGCNEDIDIFLCDLCTYT